MTYNLRHLDWPFLISPSVFSNVYFGLWNFIVVFYRRNMFFTFDQNIFHSLTFSLVPLCSTWEKTEFPTFVEDISDL